MSGEGRRDSPAAAKPVDPSIPLTIGGTEIAPGARATIDLPVARLYTHTQTTLPLQVVRGRKAGPVLFVSAALHGDEIGGVEIIRRLLQHRALKGLRGCLIAAPVVNVYAFLNQSRYSPDRRDLNRCFPGIGEGSLTSRLARLFMEEVVERCTHGIDLHTGSNHRANLPQVRVRLEDEEGRRLAMAFGAPIVIDAELRDGSLREAVQDKGIPVLVYEAGEALRFHEPSIRTGVRGVLAVMRELKMLPKARKTTKAPPPPAVSRRTSWVRTPISGIFNARVPLGAMVREKDLLATIADPFGGNEEQVRAPMAGIVIGILKLPLVHQGDALLHLAELEETDSKSLRALEHSVAELVPPPVHSRTSNQRDGR